MKNSILTAFAILLASCHSSTIQEEAQLVDSLTRATDSIARINSIIKVQNEEYRIADSIESLRLEREANNQTVQNENYEKAKYDDDGNIIKYANQQELDAWKEWKNPKVTNESRLNTPVSIHQRKDVPNQ